MINVKCLKCNNEYGVDEQLFGNKSKVIGKCKCGNKITFILDESKEWQTEQPFSEQTKSKIICPKCKLEQIESDECSNCGVIFSKLSSIKQENVSEPVINNKNDTDNTPEYIEESQKTTIINNDYRNNKYKLYAMYLSSFVLLYINTTAWVVYITIFLPILIFLPDTRPRINNNIEKKYILKHIIICCVVPVIFSFFFFNQLTIILSISVITTSLLSVILYLSFHNIFDTYDNLRASEDISYGVPIEFVDIIGNILSIQSKVLLLNFNIDNHRISESNKIIAVDFIKRHNLFDTKVRFNEYDPGDELKRLFKKNRINYLLKYLFGTLNMIFYTLNPGRLFGGDYFNPTTNTVNIYSNHPAIILHELGHALDFRKRKYPGLYMILRYIPFVSLYQEFKASEYAIEYFKENKYYSEELKAYRILYPAYSTYVFGSVFEYIPSPLIVSLFFPFVIIGHILGFVHSNVRKKQINLNENKILNNNVEKSPMNWIALLSILPGFIIGFYLFQIVGAVIGSILTYFCYQEYVKYKSNSSS